MAAREETIPRTIISYQVSPYCSDTVFSIVSTGSNSCYCIQLLKKYQSVVSQQFIIMETGSKLLQAAGRAFMMTVAISSSMIEDII